MTTGPNVAPATGPARWLGGARSAFAVTVDFDAEEVWIGEHPDNARRPGVLSQGTYGAKVAVPLVLDVLARVGLRATFFVPGRVAERHPRPRARDRRGRPRARPPRPHPHASRAARPRAGGVGVRPRPGGAALLLPGRRRLPVARLGLQPRDRWTSCASTACGTRPT